MLRKNKQTPQEQSDQEFNLALEVPAEQRPKGWRPFVRRNWKRIAAAACAAAVAGAFLLPGKGAKPAGVDTEYLESAVERRNITNVFSGSGTIAAANTYTVNALVSGTVLTADFAVGDTIEEGTVLYTIDSSNAANSVEKARLSLDQAQRAGIGKIQLPERADHHRLHRRHRDRPLRERGLLRQRRYRAGQDLRQGADQAGAERLR